MHKYRPEIRALTILRSLSDKAESAGLGLIHSNLLLSKPDLLYIRIKNASLLHNTNLMLMRFKYET